ncbi:MAG: signal recognition particle-docking protein FtsY [Clostridiales bacterium]|nr:signal recognition particle-docking protein FtsY [Clostridiales bacterium]
MGILDIFKKGLANTRNFFAGGFTKIAASTGHFDEDMLDELEELMIRADCGVPASEDIITRVKEDIKKTGNDSHEAVLGSVRTRMTEILGDKSVLELVPGKLNIVLMIGVNGTGKTTTAGKLALRWKNEGKRVILGAADTFRAAAVDQLKAWGERTGTTVISQGSDGADPAAVVYDSVHAALSRKADVLIVDTAGRLHNKKNLMDELAKIRRIIAREAPEAEVKSLLIIDATTGQNAVIQAESFGEVTGIDYVGITKLDGSAKGGVAIAVAYQSGKPIVLAGLGEGAEDLVDFDPEIFVDSLLES